MEKPLPVHEGNDPYVFVSYSRDDAPLVFPEIRWLQQQGINVWYDAGIRPGSEWSDALANAIAGCSGFFFFITPRSVASENCRRELNFALEENRQVLGVHLTDTELPRGVRLSLNNRQAVIRSQFEEPTAFREVLLAFAREQTIQTAARAVSGSAAIQTQRGTQPRSRRMYVLTIGALLTLVAGVSALLLWRHSTAERWAMQEMLPTIRDDIAADNFGSAFTKAEAVEARLGSDYLPSDVWEQIAVEVSIDSAPQGAKMSYRQYGEPNDQWIDLGETPVAAVRMPRTMLLLRAEKPGFAPTYRVSNSPGIYLRGDAPNDTRYPSDPPSSQAIELVAADSLPHEMVRVPASQTGEEPPDIPAFLIDRYETTNRDYQAFIDAGGYADPVYWRDLDFRRGDVSLDWQKAVAGFVDATGHPGPATWELGKHPNGDADLPVTGISWFEAAAYARYRGKSLPTVHHWARAASGAGGNESFSAALISQSNFGGHLREIGSTFAVGPYGTSDLLGNAREWTANASGVDRVTVGSAASDAPYTAFAKVPTSPWDRSNMTGVRCAIYLEPPTTAQIADVPGAAAIPPIPQAMSDELFDGVISAGQFLPFDSSAEVRNERQLSGNRIRQVSLRTGLADERFDVFVIIPNDATPPYQALVYMSGDYAFKPNARFDDQIKWDLEAVFTPILRTGRVVIWPTWYQSFSRYDGLWERLGNDRATAATEIGGRWRRDAAAILDYMSSSAEFSDSIGWLGLSFGATDPFAIVGSFAPPFKCAILISGGALIDTPREVTLYRRMELPTLLLKGRYDKAVPVAQAQRFYDLYGAAPEDKRLVIYDAEHWPLPRNQIAREISSWLDRHLGPVGVPVKRVRISPER